MASSTSSRTLGRLSFLAFVATLPFAGCQCTDRTGTERWTFADDTTEVFVDTEPPPDTQPPVDTPPPPDALPPDPIDTAPPPPDTRDVSIDTWQPENVVTDVKCSEALDDRTSVIVDGRGTTWVAFHKYRSNNCNRAPTLVVARKPLGGTWREEDIQPHNYIFRLASIRPGQPKLVYPDPGGRRARPGASGTFRVATRAGPRNWNIEEIDVGDDPVVSSPGFDVDEDGESFWVTFTYDRQDDVKLFEYDTTAANPSWDPRATLRVEDPHAALARGLQTDPDEDVYLVHRDGSRNDGPYGIARYDKGADTWRERDYLNRGSDTTVAHSLELRSNGDLCLSSVVRGSQFDDEGRLLLTCGTSTDIDRDRERFSGRTIPVVPPSSVAEGDDGTLYIAFHPPNKSSLKLAKREPGSPWSVQTIYPDSASAASIAIDRTGDLVIAFYTETDDGRTALKVLRERPDSL